MRHRPYFLWRGDASLPTCPSTCVPRGWSAAWRNHLIRALRRGHLWREVHAPRRSIAASLRRRAALPAPALGVPRFRDRPGRNAVSELLAAGHSARGRSPGTARARGDTWSLRPRAPHPAPSSERLMMTPSMSKAAMYIYSYRNLVSIITLTHPCPMARLSAIGARPWRTF